MSRMSLDTAIRLSAEVKGGGNITKVQREIQSLAASSKLSARELGTMRVAAVQLARANDGTVAGIRSSIAAFRGLQEQAKIGSREFQRYGSEIQRLEGRLRGLDGTASQTNARFTGMAAAAGRLIAAYAGIEAVRFVFGNAAELESQTRSLQVLTGSADRAKQIVEELQQLGAVTPFTSTELIDTAKRLQAFGVETEQVVDITKRLADVSGATGAELAGLATAYGQVQAKGRLQGEELLQFQERGVALQEVLRKEYGLTGTEFQKALEKGQISAEAVEYALKKLTDTGGKYANGAIAQSDTLNGRLSTLADSTQVLAQTIGKTLEPVFKWALSQATAVVGEIQRMIDEANNAGGAKDREAQFANNANAAVRAMGLNPFTQQGMMADMRQRNIEQQRADYNLSRQRARAANNAPAPITRPPLSGNAMDTRIGATVGGGGGGDKPKKQSAAGLEAEGIKAQADAAEKMREQLKAADSINVALKDRLALAQTTEPVARQMLEYDIKQNELTREYEQLKSAAAGPDELILLNANLIIEQRIEQIEHEEKLNSLLAERAVLMANVAAQAAMPTVYNELETQEAALQAVLDKYPAIGAAADAASTLATSGISEMIAGTKDAKEVFVDFLSSIADALMDTAKQMIAQYIAIGIARMFAGMGSSVATDAGGWATSFATPQPGVGTGFNFDAAAMTGGTPWSFAGGGYTGNAPRAGGVDGQGGFPAILHPRETVIDHTRAISRQGAATMASAPVNVTVNVDASGNSQVSGDQNKGAQLGRVIANAVEQELVRQKRQGGLLRPS
jgi:tape measure domain-containing protein